MNIPFHLMSLETKVQVIIAYADMALVSAGRFFQPTAPLAIVVVLAALAMNTFQSYTKRSWRRILR